MIKDIRVGDRLRIYGGKEVIVREITGNKIIVDEVEPKENKEIEQ